MDNKTITINNAQRNDYENVDKKNSKILLKRYFNILKLDKLDKQITILDVGGGKRVFYKSCI